MPDARSTLAANRLPIDWSPRHSGRNNSSAASSAAGLLDYGGLADVGLAAVSTVGRGRDQCGAQHNSQAAKDSTGASEAGNQ
jgi:hypothetical protein